MATQEELRTVLHGLGVDLSDHAAASNTKLRSLLIRALDKAERLPDEFNNKEGFNPSKLARCRRGPSVIGLCENGACDHLKQRVTPQDPADRWCAAYPVCAYCTSQA